MEKELREEELDFSFLLSLFIKNKKLILGVTLVAIITSIIVSFSLTPVYEAKVSLKIGKYVDLNPLTKENQNSGSVRFTDASQLVEELKFIFIDSRKKENSRPYDIINISTKGKVEALFSITSHSESKKEAIKGVEEIVNYVQGKHEKFLEDIYNYRNLEIKKNEKRVSFIKDKTLATLNNQLARLQTYIKTVDDKVKESSSVLSKLKKNKNGKNVSLALFELNSRRRDFEEMARLQREEADILQRKALLEEKLEELENFISFQKYSISSSAVEKTHKVGAIASFDSPVWPNKKLIVISSTFLSFILTYLFCLVRFILREETEL